METIRLWWRRQTYNSVVANMIYVLDVQIKHARQDCRTLSHLVELKKNERVWNEELCEDIDELWLELFG